MIKYIAADFTDPSLGRAGENALGGASFFQVQDVSGTSYMFDVSLNISSAEISEGGLASISAVPVAGPMFASMTGGDVGDTPETAGLLPSDGIINGSTDFDNDEDWFAIDLRAGEFFEAAISLNAIQSIFFVDENGDEIPSTFTQDFDEASTLTRGIRADEDMTVFLVVASGTAFPPGDSLNEYTVFTQLLFDEFSGDFDTTGVLVLDGTMVQSDLLDASDRDWFAIELNSDQGLRVDLVGLGDDTEGLEVTLINAEGDIVSLDRTRDIDGGETFLTANILEGGTYYVQVSGGEGDYQLAATSVPFEDDIGEIPSQLIKSGLNFGTLETAFDEDEFTFFAQAGEILHFILDFDEPNGFILPTIFDEDGNQLTFDFFRQEQEAAFISDVGFDVQGILQFETAGTYTINLDGGSFASLSPFAYTLLTVNQPDFGTTAALNFFLNSQDGSGGLGFTVANVAWAVLPVTGRRPGGPETDTITLQTEFDDTGLPTNEGRVDLVIEADETLFQSALEDRLEFGEFVVLSNFDNEIENPVFLTNNGTIWGQARAISRPTIQGDFAELVNNGEIVSLATSGIATAINGDNASVVNNGSITAFSQSSSAIGVDIFRPAEIREPGTNTFTTNPALINTGTIEAWAGPGFVTGAAFAAALRVFNGGGNPGLEAVIDNSGTISARGFDAASAVTLLEGLYEISNSGLIVAETSIGGALLSVAIDALGGGQVNLINTGVIQAEIALLLSGSNTVINENLIIGDIIAGDSSADGFFDTFTNNGVIFGNIDLREGTDEFFGAEGEVLGIIFGGDGDDTIHSGRADDAVFGDAGNDQLIGGLGNDTLNGGQGADIIDGGVGFDFASYQGSAGGVTINLTAGAGFFGFAAGDALSGIEGLIGSGFDDMFSGTAAANILRGEAGDDVLVGGGGNDRLEGGLGDDTLNGGEDNDRLLGEAGVDTLIGAAGDDTLLGGADDDRLVGGSGQDNLAGGSGSDALNGGAGNDVLEGQAGLDSLIGGDGNDQLFGGSGRDILNGGADEDELYGGAANDSLNGDTGADLLDGGTGNDVLLGGDGDDMLLGGDGNDRVNGADGDDRLEGGTGNDAYIGGAGADTFVFEAGFGRDRVFDFEDGVDVLEIGAGLASSFEDFTIRQAGDDVILFANGDVANFIRLFDISADDLDASDFVFAADAAGAQQGEAPDLLREAFVANEDFQTEFGGQEAVDVRLVNEAVFDFAALFEADDLAVLSDPFGPDMVYL